MPPPTSSPVKCTELPCALAKLQKMNSNLFIFHLQFAVSLFQAREANNVGDRMRAEQNSKTAKTLNHVGLGIGIGVLVLSIIYVVVVATLVAH